MKKKKTVIFESEKQLILKLIELHIFSDPELEWIKKICFFQIQHGWISPKQRNIVIAIIEKGKKRAVL
jgi:hypothetical protein